MGAYSRRRLLKFLLLRRALIRAGRLIEGALIKISSPKGALLRGGGGLIEGALNRCIAVFELVNLDLFRTVSLPQFSFTAMLAYSKKKIPYITDPTMYDTAEAGLKGGLNIVAKRITEIEDHSKEKILYTDMKSMYVHTMQQPCDRLLEIAQTVDLNQEGALVTIDVFSQHTYTITSRIFHQSSRKKYTHSINIQCVTHITM